MLFLGCGEQFRFWALASFSQAAAYLQLRGPPGDVAMQNAAFPVVCGVCMPPGEELVPIVACAWAIETTTAGNFPRPLP